MADTRKLEELAKLVRYYILKMTTAAGSGHPTSSLSATDIMVALFFSKLRFDINNPANPHNDRMIFSKGHASPLLYALYAAAGILSEKELDSYRKFKSPLEGHPTPRFEYVEVATGSLGQGLSIGLGMVLAMRSGAEVGLSAHAFSNASVLRRVRLGSDTLTLRQAQGSYSESAVRKQTSPRLKARGTRDTLPKVYVLMGDSETAEGSVWEAIELASYYMLGNLVGICDVNRLGQSGQTMLGWDVGEYKRRVEAFGWEARIVDGHDMGAIVELFDSLPVFGDKPVMIIAKTIKGKGVSFLENKEGWHGKALSQEQFEEAVKELGKIDRLVRGVIKVPKVASSAQGPVGSSSRSTSSADPVPNSDKNRSVSLRALSGTPSAAATPRCMDKLSEASYKIGEMVATRKAYGEVLAKLGEIDERIVCLDAEVKNSTFAEIFKEKFPERFYEMFIAEQNMVGVALGMSKRGFVPFVSTFAAFLTRAHDQIRMSAYCRPNIKFMGSHSGVSIGEDGPSQMGLEDLAMFRAVFGSRVLVPSDAVSCVKLFGEAARAFGLFYIRTARPATPVIYKEDEEFKIGGSKVVRSSKRDQATVVACGVSLIESIKAADELAGGGINIRVIDAYSIKPIDEKTLRRAAAETNNLVITIEDHYFEGGLGDAVLNIFANFAEVMVHKLAVSKMPMSGKMDELFDYEGIAASSIVKKVRELVG